MVPEGTEDEEVDPFGTGMKGESSCGVCEGKLQGGKKMDR